MDTITITFPQVKVRRRINNLTKTFYNIILYTINCISR